MCQSGLDDNVGSAEPTVCIENPRTRVTRWHFNQKGDNTGWHRHEYDYVVVPLFDGVLEIDEGSGERVQAKMQTGIPYFRTLGVEHDVINGNDFPCAFVEVEFIEPKSDPT